jgi:carboxyl-terminal processing protease
MRSLRVFFATVASAFVAILVLVSSPRLRPSVPPSSPAPVRPSPEPEPLDDGHDDERSFIFRMPSGEPTSLSCEDALAIADQVRAGLASPPESVDAASFAHAAADWLDPHGLLSAAKDAPTKAALRKAAQELLAELEGKKRRGCVAAQAPAAVVEAWVRELRDAFDRGRQAPGTLQTGVAALEPIPPISNALDAAEELGRRVGAFERAFGEQGTLYADEARKRFFPPLDAAGWSRVVLASAVRGYVPLVDPHGEWAPLDEESRIYEIDLASRPPTRLWGRAVPTAVGVRITEGAAAPLANDDLVLSVGSVATAGLPLEQIDQLGLAASDAKPALSAVVLRGERFEVLELEKGDKGTVSPVVPSSPAFEVERVAYGEGDVLLVAIKDVRDDLGEALAETLEVERERDARKLVGVVLDLRGNGGGSTDGALGALSLFLPGAPLFAMKRRDGTIELDRALTVQDRDVWHGPVATFVDAMTASAAEMIGGALATYHRGPVVGTTTFGKGCAQEYVDDDAHAGVLRLTTLVYALADGTPVQRVGLTPQIRFPFVAEREGPAAAEREAKLAHAAPSWRGPDIRDLSISSVRSDESTWPSHGGVVGPCRDSDACKALRLLGGVRRPPTAKHGG